MHGCHYAEVSMHRNMYHMLSYNLPHPPHLSLAPRTSCWCGKLKIIIVEEDFLGSPYSLPPSSLTPNTTCRPCGFADGKNSTSFDGSRRGWSLVIWKLLSGALWRKELKEFSQCLVPVLVAADVGVGGGVIVVVAEGLRFLIFPPSRSPSQILRTVTSLLFLRMSFVLLKTRFFVLWRHCLFWDWVSCYSRAENSYVQIRVNWQIWLTRVSPKNPFIVISRTLSVTQINSNQSFGIWTHH